MPGFAGATPAGAARLASSAILFSAGPGLFTWRGDGFCGFEAYRRACRRLVLGLRLDHRTHPALGTVWLPALAAAGDLEELGLGVIGDVIAADLVLAALQLRPVEHLHRFGATVVLDALGPSLDVLVEAVPLLPEVGGAAPGGAVLEALLVLADLHALAADLERALRQHDVSLEQGDLPAVVDGDLVGLQVHRLVAIGFFGSRRRGERRQKAAHQRPVA